MLQSISRTLTFTCLLRGSQKVPQFCSSDLHDDHPASCGYVQGKGDLIDGLFERFPGVGSEVAAVNFSHQYGRQFRLGWIPAKLEEMPSATQPEVRILVPAVGRNCEWCFRRTRSQDFRRLGSLSNPSLRTDQTFPGSCELWSNTSSCPADTGEKGDRILCFCTEQRGQKVGKMVDGPSEGGVDLEK